MLQRLISYFSKKNKIPMEIIRHNLYNKQQLPESVEKRICNFVLDSKSGIGLFYQDRKVMPLSLKYYLTGIASLDGHKLFAEINNFSKSIDLLPFLPECNYRSQPLILVESNELLDPSDKELQLMKEYALDSYSSKKYKLLVSVSNENAFQKISKVNGGQKIHVL